MKTFYKTIFFIILFIIFKEATYFVMEYVNIEKDPTFIGEPKDMLLMQLAVFVFSLVLVFMFYFLNGMYKFINHKIYNKVILFILLICTQIITLYVVFSIRIQNSEFTYLKTYLSVLGVSILIIILGSLVLSKVITLLMPNKIKE